MTSESTYPLLEQIDDPTQLRALPQQQLAQVADELRRFVIESVSRTGGHLAASLGTIELTTALHYVFDTPRDRLVWDIGHQAYAHKILTGRRAAMSTLRQRDGLSAFLKRGESEYDTFGAGHSSTSISAALGMAIAARHHGSGQRTVGVIGDGALTAGMAFEALNHAGHVKPDLLVILNDNEMSISPNVGGLSNYLARLLSGKIYSTMREGGKKVLSAVPPMRELARRAEEHVKGMVVPGTLFEELGFNYIGPIDGHDIDTLVATLRNLRSRRGPQFLHVVTRKGKGYAPAEDNPCAYHGVNAFDPAAGAVKQGSGSAMTYTQVFGEWLCEMAARDERLVAITPAMREGSGMVAFSEQFPDRFYDVGIAEQHSVTFAAGLACEGMRPVVAIYSTFLQRAYDQLIHDVALQNLPVLFAIDRAGLVGPDGPTHAGAFDLSYLRCIPNLTVMAPANENECYRMLTTGLTADGPCAVRYPRGCGPGVPLHKNPEPIALGKAELRRRGRKVALLAFGSPLQAALVAGEALNATVVNMRFVKPLDEAMILRKAESHDVLVTLEDNAVMGGAGTAVGEYLAAHGINRSLLHLGLPDRFTDQGPREELLGDYGLSPNGIIQAVLEHTASQACETTPIGLNSY